MILIGHVGGGRATHDRGAVAGRIDTRRTGRTVAWSICLFALGPIVAAPSLAQMLTGVVVTTEGGVIADLEVVLRGPVESGRAVELHRATTDTSGRFAFVLARDGEFVVRIEGLGYRPFTSEPLALTRADPLDVRITLDVEPLLLDPLEITSSSRPWWEVLQPAGLWPFFERRDRYGAEGRGRFFTQRDLALWRGLPVASALATALPYLRTEQAPGRPGRSVLRGPGRCEPIVFVDGAFVDLAPRGPGGRVIDYIPIDAVVDVFSLVAVESYRGMSQAPVELQTLRRGVRPNCAVVGLWTLRR